MVVSVGRLFESIARTAQVEFLEHKVAMTCSHLLERLGYKPDGSFHDSVPVLSRKYFPGSHELSVDEASILQQFFEHIKVPTF
jgi:hypothetical protein